VLLAGSDGSDMLLYRAFHDIKRGGQFPDLIVPLDPGIDAEIPVGDTNGCPVKRKNGQQQPPAHPDHDHQQNDAEQANDHQDRPHQDHLLDGHLSTQTGINFRKITGHFPAGQNQLPPDLTPEVLCIAARLLFQAEKVIEIEQQGPTPFLQHMHQW